MVPGHPSDSRRSSSARHIGAGVTLAVARASVSAQLVVRWEPGAGEWTAVRRVELRRLAAAMAARHGAGMAGPGPAKLRRAPSISPEAAGESLR